MANEAVATYSKMGLGSTIPTDEPLEFLSETISIQENFLDTAGLRGTRSHVSERVRQNTRMVQGSIVCAPTPVELDYILPKILGGTKSGNNIPMTERLTEFALQIARDVDCWNYTGCKVASAVFSASEGQPLQVTMNLMGKDGEKVAVGTFPSLTPDLTGGPYIMSDCALTVGGTSYQFLSWELTIDHGLQARYSNSLTPVNLFETDRNVSLSLSLPYGDTTALYGSAVTGVAVVATFTNATRSVSFTCPAVQAPRVNPTAGGRQQLTMPWVGIARKSGSTLELVVTNDSTV